NITALHNRISTGKTATADTFADLLAAIQNIAVRVKEAGGFISCLTAQNVRDEQAKLLSGRVKTISAAYGAALTKWEEQLLEINDSEWQELTADSRIRPIAFPLNERRRRAREKLDPQQEVLANDLAIDGYHGWQDLYNAVVGRISIPVEENGEVKHLSVGQAANMMHHSDRAVRSQVFAKWLEAWEKESELVAQSLNHLGGFRLQLYRHRGWDSVLKEPLDINRMTEATLDAMWQAIDNRKDRLVAYLERKAKLLGIEKL
ncbi:hypothetical protein MXD63_36435, partial [Frankia sp. Cpl3]|nr:hypothetical protein [Frankia sp. Cpl3]